MACALGAAPVLLPITLVGLELTTFYAEGAPLFIQSRLGLNNEPFSIFKLRTMPLQTGNTKSDGHYDERATKLGRWLRLLRVDETPQLVNVVRGDMSIVGPRPLVQSHVEEIMDSLSPSLQTNWLQARGSCRPGMIDPYAVELYVHDAIDDPLARVESDIRYAAGASFAIDRKALLAASGFYNHLIARKMEQLAPLNPEDNLL